jgi:hypothetical protein
VLVAIASFAVGTVMQFPVTAILWHPSVLKQELIELTPAMKMKRQQEGQRRAAAMLKFRQTLQIGQLVDVSDQPHDEYYTGVVVGRGGGPIRKLESNGDVSVDVAGTTVTASRARIYPLDPSDLSR